MDGHGGPPGAKGVPVLRMMPDGTFRFASCTSDGSPEPDRRPAPCATEPSTLMTPEAAARIQSHADRTGTNEQFKAGAQRAAAKRGREGGGTP